MLALLFAALTLVVAAVALRATGRVALGILWMALTAALAASGALQNFDSFPPAILKLVLLSTLLTTILCLSSLGREWVKTWALPAMVAFQAFRLPLELIMHRAATEGLMPVQMSFSGRNFDILSGLLALPVAWALSRGKGGRTLAWAWNLMGLALLINVVGVAILSMPGPLRAFPQDPPNTWITQAPYVWLPTVLVQLAWGGHLLMIRKLWAFSR